MYVYDEWNHTQKYLHSFSVSFLSPSNLIAFSLGKITYLSLLISSNSKQWRRFHKISTRGLAISQVERENNEQVIFFLQNIKCSQITQEHVG